MSLENDKATLRKMIAEIHQHAQDTAGPLVMQLMKLEALEPRRQFIVDAELLQAMVAAPAAPATPSPPAPQQDLRDGWALPDVIEALRASGFEVRGEDAAAIVYGTVEAGAVLIDGAISAFSQPAAELVAASEAGIPASVQQDRQDAERWREALMNVGGIEWMVGQRFVFRHLDPVHGANIMVGSVAEHFTQAVDAALAARKEPKP